MYHDRDISQPLQVGAAQIMHPFAEEGDYNAIQIVRDYVCEASSYAPLTPDTLTRDVDRPDCLFVLERLLSIQGGVANFQRIYANIPAPLVTWGSKVFEKPGFGESWRGRRIYTLDSETQLVADSELPITGDTQGLVTGGTFTLTTLSQTTSALAYNATAAQVETALNALSNVAAAGGVSVRKWSSIWEISWKQANKSRITTIAAGSLTPAASVQYNRWARASAPNSFTLIDTGATAAATSNSRSFAIWSVGLRTVYGLTGENHQAVVSMDRSSPTVLPAFGVTGYSVYLETPIAIITLPTTLGGIITKAQLEDAITSGLSSTGNVSIYGSFAVVENSAGNFTVTFPKPVGVDQLSNWGPQNRDGWSASEPAVADYVSERFCFYTAGRALTITGHGRTVTAPGWVIDGSGLPRRVPSLSVVDANTLSTDGAIDLAGSSSLLVNPRKYRPGNVVSKVRRTREFFAPGLTPGISAPQDMPTIQPSTPQEYLDAVMQNTPGVELVVEADEVTRYLGPIFVQQKTVMLVENATEVLE